MRIPLAGDDTFLSLSPRWSDLALGWQIAVLGLLLVVPALLVAWLYRYELRLVRRGSALGLLGLRLLLIVLLWGIVTLQPTLSHIATENVPSEVLVAVDLSASMDVADIQRMPDESDALAHAFGVRPADVGGWSRKEIARRVLASDGLDLLNRLAQCHRVELIGFHATRWRANTAAVDELFAPGETADAQHATDLGQVLRDSGNATTPRHGVIVLTDGRHNQGAPPLALAKQFGNLGIPIYPVAIGSLRSPTDLLVASVQAPASAFKDTSISVTAQIKARRLPAQELTIDLHVGAASQQQKIKHTGGDGIYEVKFSVQMEAAGTQEVTVKAQPARGGEITLANNQRSHIVRVAQDKARVLVVDDEARWEYHYLAGALARDPTLRLDRVLFSPPRLGLAKEDDLDRLGLPRLHLPTPPVDAKATDPLNDYDCIILGDVPPEKLPPADRKRLERYVSERGGTLIVSAGKRAMPMAYTSQPGSVNDPIVKMLPLREPRNLNRKDGFALGLTAEGKRTPFLQLDTEPRNDRWAELPPHYWAIIGTRQPGATTLATVLPTDADAKPATDEQMGWLVQQSYGFGKVIFVGIDSTWRWRFKTGDTYHHRFWGQLVRWAAAERLLPAGNRLARFGTREPVYTHGQEVELAVRLSAEAPPLKNPERAVARVLRKKPDGAEVIATTAALQANARQGKLLAGKLRDLAAGDYRVELDIPELLGEPTTGDASFRVLPEESAEMLDLSTNWELLQGLAQQSQGRLFTPADVEQVLDLLAEKVRTRESRLDSKPWQDVPLVWWLLGVLVGLLTLEWAWRKAVDLP